MFNLEFTQSALDDLDYLKKFEQNIILDAIEAYLSTEPLTRTRKRKPLRPNSLSSWALRIGKYRVFYDVDTGDNNVKIKAIGWKLHNRLIIRGKEFTL